MRMVSPSRGKMICFVGNCFSSRAIVLPFPFFFVGFLVQVGFTSLFLLLSPSAGMTGMYRSVQQHFSVLIIIHKLHNP